MPPEPALVDRVLARVGPRGLHDGLSPAERLGLRYLWRAWARPGSRLPSGEYTGQLLPEGDWTTALALCGRGFGKTRMANEWARSIAERVPGARICLMGETANAARKVLGFGSSGLAQICPPWAAPRWSVMDQSFTWPNGSIAFLLSAEAPDSPRGHEFDAVILDEAAAYAHLAECVSNVRLALRRGAWPKMLITTTPRPLRYLRELAKAPGTITLRGSTDDNARNLPQSFLDDVRKQYGGTSLGRQELDGVLLDELDGACVRRAWIDRWRVKVAPQLVRIAVGVDPSFSERKGVGHDEAGVVTIGIDAKGLGYVLADDSLTSSPDAWAHEVSKVFHREKASFVVYESNRGGAAAGTVLKLTDRTLPLKDRGAGSSKRDRLEPVAALLENGRLRFVGDLARLEDELCSFVVGSREQDGRIDALVWAASELLIKPPPFKHESAHGLGPARRVTW